MLGLGLSLDNFRVAIALGALPLSLSKQLRVAVVFGLWDGLTPLLGFLIGHLLGRIIGPVAADAGPIVLGFYGLFLLYRVLRTSGPFEPDERMILFGLPLSLSLDNIVAGTGLGMLGFAPLVAASTFAAITAAMSLIGMHLGSLASRFLPIRTEILAGASLILVALLLALGY